MHYWCVQQLLPGGEDAFRASSVPMVEPCHLAAEEAILSLMKVALKSRTWCLKGLIPVAKDSLVCADMTFEGMTLGNQQLWLSVGNYCFRPP